MVSFMPIQFLCWHLVPHCHVLISGRGERVSGSISVSCHSKLKEFITVCDRSCSRVPLVADVAAGAGSASLQWNPDSESWRGHLGTLALYIS